MGNPFSGQPDFSGQLNATLVQTFQNGSVIKTPCYFDASKTPMQATSLTPVDEHLLAGPEVDRYITIDSDTSHTKYRQWETIGTTQQIEID